MSSSILFYHILYHIVLSVSMNLFNLSEDFSELAFGVGPRSCLGRPLAEAPLGAHLKSQTPKSPQNESAKTFQEDF